VVLYRDMSGKDETALNVEQFGVNAADDAAAAAATRPGHAAAAMMG